MCRLFSRQAQVLIEYLVLTTIVAIMVVLGMVNGGVSNLLNPARRMANEYYTTGTKAIVGGYMDTTGNYVALNPDPINGGWCDWGSCIDGWQERECACPRTAFGGIYCNISSPNSQGFSVAVRQCGGGGPPGCIPVCGPRECGLDPLGCDGCGTCQHPFTCDENGICQCPSGWINCSGTCEQLGTNQHCSSCAPCSADRACQGGSCQCTGGRHDCSGACVDFGTNQHCSSCAACTGGRTCQGGSCQCTAGTPDVCNNMCVNRQTDSHNCGTCGHICPTGASCVSGTCTCPPGMPDTYTASTR